MIVRPKMNPRITALILSVITKASFLHNEYTDRKVLKDVLSVFIPQALLGIELTRGTVH